MQALCRLDRFLRQVEDVLGQVVTPAVAQAVDRSDHDRAIPGNWDMLSCVPSFAGRNDGERRAHS